MDLRKSAIVLPNSLTLGSLCLGFYAIVTLADGGPGVFSKAALALLFAMILDGLDGRVARLTGSQSKFGVQLDSLVDLVSFGIAPAFLMYKWALHAYGGWGIIASFAFAGCGAVRLARFNCEAETDGGCGRFFLGLPIPAAAGTLLGMVLLHEGVYGHGSLTNQSGALLLVLVLSFLMVSNVRFRTFKDFRMTRSKAVLITCFIAGLGASAALVHPWFPLIALFAIYLLSGVLGDVLRLGRSRSFDEELEEVETEATAREKPAA